MKFILSFILLLSSLVYGQSEIDILLNRIEQADGIEKIDLINQISFEHYRVSPQKGIEYAEHALQMSEEIQYKKGIAAALQNKGLNLWAVGRMQESLALQNEALEMFELMNDHEGMGESLINIGLVYSDRGEMEKALQYNLDVLNLADQYEDDIRKEKAYNNIGIIYSNLNNLPKALYYFLKSLELSRQNETVDATALANIGMIYWRMEKLDSALYYIEKTKAIDEKTGNKKGIAINSGNLGLIHTDKNELDLALASFKTAYELYSELNDHQGMAITAGNLAFQALQDENFEEAKTWLEKGIDHARKGQARPILYSLYAQLSNLYAETGNPGEALAYAYKYATLKDSIINEESSRQIAEMQTRFESEKKQQEIDFLKKEKALQDQVLKRQNMVKNILITATVLIFLAGIFLYYLYRQKRTINSQLHAANEEISRHQRTLFDINREQSKLLEELNETNSAKDKFFSIIAHDIKNPLQTLLSGSRLLSKSIDKLDEKSIKEIAEGMRARTENLFDLLENLLQWSKVQMGNISHEPGILNLKTLAQKWVLQFSAQADQKKIQIYNNIKDDAAAFADTMMIESVIQNLLTNAVKFTRQGGKIELFAERHDGYAQITVKDNGIGINEERINKLFNLQENITTRGTEDEKGSGLGLILCKDFIEKNRGKIWIESETDKGTSVHFTLPLPDTN